MTKGLIIGGAALVGILLAIGIIIFTKYSVRPEEKLWKDMDAALNDDKIDFIDWLKLATLLMPPVKSKDCWKAQGMFDVMLKTHVKKPAPAPKTRKKLND